MEPALVVCAGVATITLTLGALRSLLLAARRLSAVRIPIPARSIASLLVMTSCVVLVGRTRPSTATVPPPIVRLTDSAQAGDADGEPSVAVPVLPEEPARAGSGPAVHPASSDSRHDTYIVRVGDSLWRIAERTLLARNEGSVASADIGRFWPSIYEANRVLIGDDPNLIFPGQMLEIPEV